VRLSQRLGNRVLLKREDLQPVFSFKLRGAYNRIARLAEASARRGVVCASAGNHAQGVALAAQRRGIAALVVMPETPPAIKVQAVSGLGAEVLQHGDDYDSAFEHAVKLARERNLVFVHPFDDPDVIEAYGRDRAEARQAAGSAAKVTSSDEEDDDDARRSSGGNGGSASGGGGDLGHRCCIQSCVLGTGPVLVACTALVPSERVALDCKL